jgi:hypothetical protein
MMPRPRRSKVRAVGVSGTGDGDVRLVPAVIESVRADTIFILWASPLVLYSPEYGGNSGTPDAVPQRACA